MAKLSAEYRKIALQDQDGTMVRLPDGQRISTTLARQRGYIVAAVVPEVPPATSPADAAVAEVLIVAASVAEGRGTDASNIMAFVRDVGYGGATQPEGLAGRILAADPLSRKTTGGHLLHECEATIGRDGCSTAPPQPAEDSLASLIFTAIRRRLEEIESAPTST
jgi:hypothetical protein